jgi:hypothetical protein
MGRTLPNRWEAPLTYAPDVGRALTICSLRQQRHVMWLGKSDADRVVHHALLLLAIRTGLRASALENLPCGAPMWMKTRGSVLVRCQGKRRPICSSAVSASEKTRPHRTAWLASAATLRLGLVPAV